MRFRILISCGRTDSKSSVTSVQHPTLKIDASNSQKVARIEEVHVQLEVPVCASPGDGRIVADHLRSYHRHRFADDRVYFSGRDRAARLRRGK
jgi:hypothetical protein